MTLTQKIVSYVMSNPGKTATQVARGLDPQVPAICANALLVRGRGARG